MDIKNLIDLLPYYFKSNDTYKDSEGKGILEKFLNICGTYFSDVITPEISSVLDNLNIETTSKYYLGYLWNMLGSIPYANRYLIDTDKWFKYFKGFDDPQFSSKESIWLKDNLPWGFYTKTDDIDKKLRDIIKYSITLLKWRGTDRFFKTMFSLYDIWDENSGVELIEDPTKALDYDGWYKENYSYKGDYNLDPEKILPHATIFDREYNYTDKDTYFDNTYRCTQCIKVTFNIPIPDDEPLSNFDSLNTFKQSVTNFIDKFIPYNVCYEIKWVGNDINIEHTITVNYVGDLDYFKSPFELPITSEGIVEGERRQEPYVVSSNGGITWSNPINPGDSDYGVYLVNGPGEYLFKNVYSDNITNPIKINRLVSIDTYILYIEVEGYSKELPLYTMDDEGNPINFKVITHSKETHKKIEDYKGNFVRWGSNSVEDEKTIVDNNLRVYYSPSNIEVSGNIYKAKLPGTYRFYLLDNKGNPQSTKVYNVMSYPEYAYKVLMGNPNEDISTYVSEYKASQENMDQPLSDFKVKLIVDTKDPKFINNPKLLKIKRIGSPEEYSYGDIFTPPSTGVMYYFYCTMDPNQINVSTYLLERGWGVFDGSYKYEFSPSTVYLENNKVNNEGIQLLSSSDSERTFKFKIRPTVDESHDTEGLRFVSGIRLVVKAKSKLLFSGSSSNNTEDDKDEWPYIYTITPYWYDMDASQVNLFENGDIGYTVPYIGPSSSGFKELFPDGFGNVPVKFRVDILRNGNINHGYTLQLTSKLGYVNYTPIAIMDVKSSYISPIDTKNWVSPLESDWNTKTTRAIYKLASEDDKAKFRILGSIDGETAEYSDTIREYILPEDYDPNKDSNVSGTETGKTYNIGDTIENNHIGWTRYSGLYTNCEVKVEDLSLQVVITCTPSTVVYRPEDGKVTIQVNVTTNRPSVANSLNYSLYKGNKLVPGFENVSGNTLTLIGSGLPNDNSLIGTYTIKSSVIDQIGETDKPLASATFTILSSSQTVGGIVCDPKTLDMPSSGTADTNVYLVDTNEQAISSNTYKIVMPDGSLSGSTVTFRATAPGTYTFKSNDNPELSADFVVNDVTYPKSVEIEPQSEALTSPGTIKVSFKVKDSKGNYIQDLDLSKVKVYSNIGLVTLPESQWSLVETNIQQYEDTYKFDYSLGIGSTTLKVVYGDIFSKSTFVCKSGTISSEVSSLIWDPSSSSVINKQNVSTLKARNENGDYLEGVNVSLSSADMKDPESSQPSPTSGKTPLVVSFFDFGTYVYKCDDNPDITAKLVLSEAVGGLKDYEITVKFKNMLTGTRYQLVSMDLLLSTNTLGPLTLSIGPKDIGDSTNDFFNTINNDQGPLDGYWTLSVHNILLRRYSGDDTEELKVILQDNNEDFKELVNTTFKIGDKVQIVKENLQLKSIYKPTTGKYSSELTLILNK